jgi:hypothetical protein
MANENVTPPDWDALIKDYRMSGKTGTQWCQDNGFKIHQLRWQITKRQKKINNSSDPVQWIPLQMSDNQYNPIIVRIGGAEIEIQEGFNQALFAEVVDTLRILL